MTSEALRRVLAVRLELWDSDRANQIAEVLLPTVQRLITDAEKRAAAAALRKAVYALTITDRDTGIRIIADRADALDPS